MRVVNSDDHSRAIIPLPDASLAIARPEGGRVLSELVGDTLALALEKPLRKIGKYEWCEPDYRQILLWAEALDLEPEEVIRRLLDRKNLYRDGRGMATESPAWRETTFQDGRIINVNWDLDLLPIGGFQWVENLQIEYLRIASHAEFLAWRKAASESMPPISEPPKSRRNSMGMDMMEPRVLGWDFLQKFHTKHDFNFKTANSAIPVIQISLPRLRELICEGLRIKTLDLSAVPCLEILCCSLNRLTGLDLSCVPRLKELDCSWNRLSHLPSITYEVPELSSLNCSCNLLTDIGFYDDQDLEHLEHLDCFGNNIETLDIRPLKNLKSLDAGSQEDYYRTYSCEIVQRPDQHFR